MLYLDSNEFLSWQLACVIHNIVHAGLREDAAAFIPSWPGTPAPVCCTPCDIPGERGPRPWVSSGALQCHQVQDPAPCPAGRRGSPTIRFLANSAE